MPERPQYLIDRDKVQRASQKADRDFLAQRAASSRPGQVYHTMRSLQDRMSRPGFAASGIESKSIPLKACVFLELLLHWMHKTDLWVQRKLSVRETQVPTGECILLPVQQ